jgi:hypothetical protein
MNEPSGLELESRPAGTRPILYSLDPPMYRKNNPHMPSLPKPTPVLTRSHDKFIVATLMGLGAGFAASIFFDSSILIGIIAGASALLTWECVEIN